ncbi:MAG: hypothetical protein IJ177_11910, partial [Fibrobacter sp.]|uniref:hypothetical protein n=1 Tax=Fibrobacter sp. TaxID=35828 RepID=UPI0025C6254B
PFLNCSLALAITESSSSLVIVTILSLHYSKVLGYWGWIVTQFSLQPRRLETGIVFFDVQENSFLQYIPSGGSFPFYLFFDG